MRWPLVKGCGCLAGASVGPAAGCRGPGAAGAAALDWEPEASPYWTPWCDMARAARRWEGAEDRDGVDDGAGDVEGGILAVVGWGWPGWDWRSERAVMVNGIKWEEPSWFQPPGYRQRRVLVMGREGEAEGFVGFDMQRRRRDRMTMTWPRWESDAAAGGALEGRVSGRYGASSDLGWPRKAAGTRFSKLSRWRHGAAPLCARDIKVPPLPATCEQTSRRPSEHQAWLQTLP
jgi:hypothetical protein